MKSKYKLTMCRLCLCENLYFLNIFDQNDWHGYIAAEVISNLLNYQVSESDGYPHVVCSECLVKLTDFKVFKECCLKSRVTYDNMFVSSEILEEIKTEMDIGEGGSGLELCEQHPLTETSPNVIKSEEVILDSSFYEVSEDTLKETEVSCGPILLKYEVLPFSRNSHIQEELIDSEIYGNPEKVESTAVLMQVSLQPVINQEELINDCISGDETEEPFKGFDSEEEFTDLEVSGNPEKVESTAALMQDSPQELIESETLVGATELLSTSMEDSTQQNIHAGSRSEFCEDDGASCDELIESDTFVCVGSTDLPSTSMEDSTQQTVDAGSGSEFCEFDSLRGPSFDNDMEPLKLELEEESIDSIEKLQGYIIAPEKGVGRSKARFECNHCKKVFTAKSSIVRHMKTHGFGKPFNPQELQGNVIAPEKRVGRCRQRFECDHCKKVFTTKSSIGRHMKDHGFGKPYNPEVEEGEKGTASEKGIGGRNGIFECYLCEKVLMTKKSLKQHLIIHGIGRGFKCDVCGQICVSKSSLIRHIRQHTGERPYKCTNCSKGFSYHGHLNVHMRIHTNVKPFKCKECDKTFNHSSSLKRHMRIHYNVKQYSCEVCHVNFRQKHHLTYHVRTHSGDRPFECTVCPKAFSQSSNLRRHQVVHSREKPHPCPHCSKRFSERRSLRRHLKNVCVGNGGERESEVLPTTWHTGISPIQY